MEKKIERKENYFLGIIGGIIGGLLAAIPLIFGYSYSEWIFVLALAVLVPIFEFYGYKIFRGKINNKLPIILLILTITIVLLMIFIFLPVTLLIKSGLPISIGTIKNLYANNNILISLIQDCLTSLVFAILGVYIIAVIIKRKLLLNVSNINLFSSDNKEKQELKEKAISALKPIFEKYEAVNKDKTIKKEELLADSKESKFKDYFEYLSQLQIIKKHKGKYYYSVDDENNIKLHYPISKVIIVICIVAIVMIIILFAFGSIMNNNVKKVYNDDVSFSIDKSWNTLNEYTEKLGWTYYKYLGTDTAKENSDHSYPATIEILYDKEKTEDYSSISELQSILELYVSSYLNQDGYNMEVFTTSNGYEALELVIKYEGVMELDFYIYKDGKIAVITAISYTDDEEMLDELEEYTKDVANSFEWNK